MYATFAPASSAASPTYASASGTPTENSKTTTADLHEIVGPILNGSTSAEIVNFVTGVRKQEMLCTAAILIMEGIPDVAGRFQLLKFAHNVPSDARQSFCADVGPIVKNISGIKERLEVLGLLKESIALDERQEFCIALQPILAGVTGTSEQLLHIIKFFIDERVKKKKPLCDAAKLLMEGVADATERLQLLRFARSIPSEERLKFCEAAALLLKGITDPVARFTLLGQAREMHITEEQKFYEACACLRPEKAPDLLEGVVDPKKRFELLKSAPSLLIDPRLLKGVADHEIKREMRKLFAKHKPEERGHLFVSAEQVMKGIEDPKDRFQIFKCVAEQKAGDQQNICLVAEPLVQNIMQAEGRLAILRFVAQQEAGEEKTRGGCWFARSLVQGLTEAEGCLNILRLIVRQEKWEERKEICEISKPLLQGVKEAAERLDILNLVIQLERGNRDEICRDALSFLQGVAVDVNNRLSFLRFFTKPRSCYERADICKVAQPLVQGITAPEGRLDILRFVDSLGYKRERICEAAQPLLQEDMEVDKKLVILGFFAEDSLSREKKTQEFYEAARRLLQNRGVETREIPNIFRFIAEQEEWSRVDALEVIEVLLQAGVKVSHCLELLNLVVVERRWEKKNCKTIKPLLNGITSTNVQEYLRILRAALPLINSFTPNLQEGAAAFIARQKVSQRIDLCDIARLFFTGKCNLGEAALRKLEHIAEIPKALHSKFREVAGLINQDQPIDLFSQYLAVPEGERSLWIENKLEELQGKQRFDENYRRILPRYTIDNQGRMHIQVKESELTAYLENHLLHCAKVIGESGGLVRFEVELLDDAGNPKSGADQGGLGRAFFSDLFAGLVNKQRRLLNIQRDEAGNVLFKMQKEDSNQSGLNSIERKLYESLGHLFYYFYCSGSNGCPLYVTGRHFNEKLFSGVLSLRESELNQDFSALPEARKVELCGILGEPGQLAPTFAIAKGMKAALVNVCWDRFREERADQVSDKIQGVIDRQKIVDIQMPENSTAAINQKVEWLKKWILNPSTCEADIKDFLKALTGSPSLPLSQKIVIGTQSENPSPLPNFNSDLSLMSLAPSHCWKLNEGHDNTEEGFIAALNQAIAKAINSRRG